MFSRIFLLSLFTVLRSGTSDAFRPPENPTGLADIKSQLVLKKDSKNIITAETMELVTKSATAETMAREGTIRKRWEIGVDKVAKDYVDEYWYNPTIHNFGNIGFLGAIHAALAPISTKVIDIVAYDGENIRSIVAQKLSRIVMAQNIKAGRNPGRNPRVLDMCCGVGISTRALQDAFPDSELVVGVDTSSEMINMAGFLTNHVGFIRPLLSYITNTSKTQRKVSMTKGRRKFARRAKFTIGNAEHTKFPSKTFDLVTVMYAFHEAPMEGREKILREAYRVLQPGGTLAVVDISTDYTPSDSMLSGEPYVLEYQKNIHRQMRSIRGFSDVRYRTIVQDHVGMWTLTRNN